MRAQRQKHNGVRLEAHFEKKSLTSASIRQIICAWHLNCQQKVSRMAWVSRWEMRFKPKPMVLSTDKLSGCGMLAMYIILRRKMKRHQMSGRLKMWIICQGEAPWIKIILQKKDLMKIKFSKGSGPRPTRKITYSKHISLNNNITSKYQVPDMCHTCPGQFQALNGENVGQLMVNSKGSQQMLRWN